MGEKRYGRTLRVLIVLLAITLCAMAVLAALLFLPHGNVPEPEPTSTPEPELTTAEDIGPDRTRLFLIYDGTLTDASGNAVTLSSLRGETVLLFFWSSWCGDCRAFFENGFAELLRAARDAGATPLLVFREGVREDDREKAEAELRAQGISEETLADPGAELYHSLGLDGVPSVAVLSPEGRLMYTASALPDAADIPAIIEYAGDPAGQTERFIADRLTDRSGGIVSTYGYSGGRITQGDTVLSESMGLWMLYAMRAGDTARLSTAWRYVYGSLARRGLFAWCLTEGRAGEVNASLDDLRILEALIGTGIADDVLRDHIAALYERCVREGLLRDFAELKKERVSDRVTLCYQDVAAMEALGACDERWLTAAEASRRLLLREDAIIGPELPLYHRYYDPKKDRFYDSSVQMNEALVAVLDAARCGIVREETLDWLADRLAEGAIYACYESVGSVTPGYRYESNASYALLVQLGVLCGREDITLPALRRMEKRRCFVGEATGSYATEAADTCYAFDELEALLAWQAVASGTRVEQ